MEFACLRTAGNVKSGAISGANVGAVSIAIAFQMPAATPVDVSQRLPLRHALECYALKSACLERLTVGREDASALIVHARLR